MNFYAVKFWRMTEDDNTEHVFFCHSKTKKDAVQRFVTTTGYERSCVISVHQIGE